MEGEEEEGGGGCLVCGWGTDGGRKVSIHSRLAGGLGQEEGLSVLQEVGRVVGSGAATAASQAAQEVCSRCLSLLLNIVHQEARLVGLKHKFCQRFEEGKQVREVGRRDVTTEEEEKRENRDDNTEDMKNELQITLAVTGDAEGFSENRGVKNGGVSKEDLSPLLVVDCVKELETEDSCSQPQQQPREEVLVIPPPLPSQDAPLSHTISEHQKLDIREGDSVYILSGQNIQEDTAKMHLSHISSKLDEALSGLEKFEEKCNVKEAFSCTPMDQPTTTGEPQQVMAPLDCLQKESKRKLKTTGIDSNKNDFKTTTPHRHEKQTRQHSGGGRGGKRRRVAKGKVVERQDSGQEEQLLTKEVLCEECGAEVKGQVMLQHLREAHPDLRIYPCPVCPLRYYRKKDKLTQHLRTTHKIKPHQCQGCPHQAESQSALDQHIIRHHPESRFFQCHLCPKAFRTHRYLTFVHIKRCHYGLPIKYSCEQCHKGFVDKSSFDTHKYTHSKVRNFSCEYCGATFQTPNALKVHVNTHTKEKKYVCGDCGLVCMRLSNLIAHKKRLHGSVDARLVCEVCGKSTSTKRDLRRHMLSKHSAEKFYTCSLCPRSYGAQDSLRAHLRTHSGEQPYACHCDNQAQPQQAGRESVQLKAEEGDDLVVITLKECPPLTNSSQHPLQPQLQHILVSSAPGDQPLTGHHHSLPHQEASLPLVHAQGDSMSTPVLLPPSTAPMLAQQQVFTAPEALQPPSQFLPPAPLPTHHSDKELQGVAADNLITPCASPAPTLLHLQPSHPSTLSLALTWPSPTL